MTGTLAERLTCTTAGGSDEISNVIKIRKEIVVALLDALVAEPVPVQADEDGVLRVGGTRVRLDTVIGAFKNGCAAEEILLKYPSLKLTDIYAVITYYLWHREAVEAYVEDRARMADEVRRENESRFPPQGLRDRLLARRVAKP
jgi:uncharacterized protein (DUF433 family)